MNKIPLLMYCLYGGLRVFSFFLFFANIGNTEKNILVFD